MNGLCEVAEMYSEYKTKCRLAKLASDLYKWRLICDVRDCSFNVDCVKRFKNMCVEEYDLKTAEIVKEMKKAMKKC